MATVTSLYVYPIKSCHALPVSTVLATRTGFAWDRQWMIVDEATGKFLSQRQEPRLALIHPLLPAGVLEGAPPSPTDVLVLSAPGAKGEVRVPLAPAQRQPLRRVTVWEWTGDAADEGDVAAAWLSAFLGKPVRLVRYLGSTAAAEAAADGSAPVVVRPTDADFVPGGEVAFADGFPILLSSEESLSDLNARLKGPVPMARFRPNVVVAGAGAPFAEDAWGRIRVGGGGAGALELDVVRPCDRCGLPAVDQETGVKCNESPLDALQTFRTGKLLGWAEARKRWTHAAFFATFVVPRASGLVRKGDTLDVLESRSWES